MNSKEISKLRYEIGEGSEEEEIYKENLLDHYKNPRNKGTIKDANICHRELNPICGDEIKVYLKVEKNNKTKKEEIVDAKFEGHGCAISQASISMLTEKLKGMNIKDVMKIDQEEILEMLGIKIGIVRMKCAMLSLKAVHYGLKNENKK